MLSDGSVSRIAVLSDQPVLLKGFSHVLHVSGFAVDSWSPNAATTSPADIVLMDITAGLTFGDLTALNRRLPEVPVVLWADALPLDVVLKTLQFGVRGVVQRTALPNHLVEALRRVMAGEMQIGFATQSAANPGRRQSALTPRETEIVEWLRQGLRNKEIADHMGITEGTVKIYLFRLFHKLGVKNRFELARTGSSEGITSIRSVTALAAGASRRQAPS